MFFHTGREFEIYAIGDGLYMQRILNGVAAMSNSGTLTGLVALGLIVGLLVMAVRNVMAGGWKLEIGTLLTSFLLAVFLFGMRADVLVHDMSYVPGQKVQGDFTVANMPFGVAAIGSFVSTIGVTLTERMEQGYSIPGMEDMAMSRGGFGKVLEWVNSIRLWEVPPTSVPGGSRDMALFKSNLDAYIRDCTIPGVEMGHVCLDAVRAAPDPLTPHTLQCTGGIGYMTNYRTVEFVTGYGPSGTSGGGKQTVVQTCADGFLNLAANAGNGASGFYDVLGSVFPESVGAASAQQVFANAYQSIGVASGDVQGIVVANAVGASLDQGLRTFQNRLSMTAMSELMIEQASQQRLVQWAAEETMFRRIMRPMMAFFESIMYALAPFMALAVGLGTFGFSTIMRYVALSLWVSLWMPVLSIIQLFQITAVQHVVKALYDPMTGSMAMNPTSIAGAHTLRSEALEWMATGAALAAWTPIITMALVYGGSYTASALAGKMQGQDTINEKMAAPDVVNAPPSIQRGSMGEFSEASQARMAGAPMPTVDTRQAMSASESMSVSRANTSMGMYLSSMGRTYAGQFSAAQYSQMQSVLAQRDGTSDTLTGEVSSTHRGEAGATGTTSEETGIESSRVETNTARGGISGTGKMLGAGRLAATRNPLGMGAGAALGALGFGAETRTASQDGTNASSTDRQQTSEGQSRSGGDNIARARQIQSDLGYLKQWGEANNASWTSTVSEAHQDVSNKIAAVTRTLSHETRSGREGTWGSSQTAEPGAINKWLVNQTGSQAAADRVLAQAGAATGIGNFVSQVAAPDMQTSYGIDRGRAAALGTILALSGHYDNHAGMAGAAPLHERRAALGDILEGRGIGPGGVSSGYVPPEEGRNLAGGAGDPAEAAARVADQVVTSRVDPDAIEAASGRPGPGSRVNQVEANDFTGGAVSGAEVAAGGSSGLIEDTVAGGQAARAGVKAYGADQRAAAAERVADENPASEASSRHLEEVQDNPGMAAGVNWGATYQDPERDGQFVYNAGFMGSVAAKTGYIESGTGMEEYQALREKVSAELGSGVPDSVQATVAMHLLGESGVKPAQDVIDFMNSEAVGAKDHADLVGQLTDTRRGEVNYNAAHHRARADEAQSQADQMPDWTHNKPNPDDGSPVD